MASIRKEVSVNMRADEAWGAVRDVGALHTRLVPGFVADTQLEEGARRVTFGDGTVARELIVGIDDDLRRLAYTIAPNERIEHYAASVEVFTEGDGSRIVWTIDVLPHELGAYIAERMERGIEAMKLAFEHG